MDKIREDADASAAKKEKKLKKNKTKTDDLFYAGAGEGVSDVGGDLLMEKGHKHKEKKRKSKSNEDGNGDQHDKGDLVNDGGSHKTEKKEKEKEKKKKKRKQDSSENIQGQNNEPAEEIDCDPKLEKKKKKKTTDTEMNRTINEVTRVKKPGVSTQMDKTGEDAEASVTKKDKKSKKNKTKTDDLLYAGAGEGVLDVGGDLLKEKGHNHNKEKKTKSKSNEDGNGSENQHDKGDLVNDDGSQKTEKKKRKRDSSENKPGQDNEPAEEIDCDPKLEKKKKKKKTDTEMDRTMDNEDGEDFKGKKKTKSVKSSKKQMVKVKSGEVNKKTVENKNTEKPKTKGKSKKVSFAGQVEVFPASESESEKQPTKQDDLVRGKRFTPEEDEIVKQAVLDYVTANGLGDDGLKKVLNCKSHAGMKKCWQEIGTCIPYRPHTAVYSRAHILFERSENRSWTPEEIELLKEYHKKHGNDWKKLADELGKHRFHVKDTWRRIKFENLKLGKWSQEEYQNLYDLVNMDLQMKVNSEKKSKHGMLRDNIPWTAISEKLSTRSDSTCCTKWYNQLTSSLVVEKKWSDADDYRMIGALYELDAACVEDVDWDNLLEHRPGDICRKRWDQMVKYIDHGSKPFAEQVDILAKRYSPDLAETREAWDNKPVVP
ncbi:uncharacterized protein [Rutidosis leptorrhynchoides]|uniref:uncharacterized protein n=1 Tax=Rutidosis leptorrhynchoides TaxID=125765 RepID=UPI003A99E6DD